MAKYPNVRRCGNEPNKGKKQSKELDEGIRLAYGRVLGKAPAKFGNFGPEKWRLDASRARKASKNLQM